MLADSYWGPKVIPPNILENTHVGKKSVIHETEQNRKKLSSERNDIWENNTKENVISWHKLFFNCICGIFFSFFS